MPMELRERMIHLRRKSFVLLASFLLALAGVLAATHRSKPKPPADDESRSQDRTAAEQIPIKAQSQKPVAPEAICPIDRLVIAGYMRNCLGDTKRIVVPTMLGHQ